MCQSTVIWERESMRQLDCRIGLQKTKEKAFNPVDFTIEVKFLDPSSVLELLGLCCS